MGITINRNTKIRGVQTKAAGHAAKHLLRDIEKCLIPCLEKGDDIVLKEEAQEKECFCLRAGQDCLEICASDELGFIYGIYEVSRSLLGVADFWFWNDQEMEKKEKIAVPENYQFQSVPCRVKYRGWFVNDEVLLHTWSVDRNQDKPWEMVFEALLRCGGNMVIPGTDRNSERYRPMASEMGLYITHHHAEPLGAEMFARAYPGLKASYMEHSDKFQRLWKEAVESQKKMHVIWNLGFRGQGDCPFWNEDSRCRTDEERGNLLSSLIAMQYEIVRKADPDAVCCTNLYGEIMELYQKGMLRLPEDIIKIWADNGYGKMVSRRQGNDNPRIPALPEKGNTDRNGIYYHMSFYDLQAANHITMLPNSPSFVKKELEQVLERRGDEFWLINCSNVKPHVYLLELAAEMWKKEVADISAHRLSYVERYYGEENAASVAACLESYPDHAVKYGPNEDDHAGEQFANHVARMLVSQYMRDEKKKCEDLAWAVQADSLKEQIKWYASLCRKAAGNYSEYLRQCEQTVLGMQGKAECLFRDSLLLQVKIHTYGYTGAALVCESLDEGMRGEYQMAFYHAGCAKREYEKANDAMKAREHGKWHGFYENECLTDVKQTAWVLGNLMGYLRNLGDGPHFYKWQREYLYAEEDRRVKLVLNMENHLRDEELFSIMEERLEPGAL